MRDGWTTTADNDGDDCWTNPFRHSSRPSVFVGGDDDNYDGDDDDDDDDNTAKFDGGGVPSSRPHEVKVVQEARGGLSDGNWLWSRYVRVNV